MDCISVNLELQLQLQAGQSGPILMHAVCDLSVQALPAVVAMLEQYNRKIVFVEDMVRAKYSASSSAVMAAWPLNSFSAQAIGDNAVEQYSVNTVIAPVYR